MFEKRSSFKPFVSAEKSRFHIGFSFISKGLLTAFPVCFSLAADSTLWLDHPHFKLPGPQSSGLTQAAALNKSKLKYRLSTIDPAKWPLPDKRPVPQADFMARDTPGRQGNISYKKIPVELLEEAGVSRKALVSFGFPLPQGALYDLARLRLTDGRKELPASYAITAKYPDNSLKWLMIRSAVPLKAREKKILFVEFGSKLPPRKALEKPLVVTTKGDHFLIDTGVLKARINKKRFTFVNDISVNGRYAGSVNGFGALLVLKDGKRMGTYKLVPRSVRLIESTPHTAIFRIDGDFWDKKNPYASYTARIAFHRNIPGFELEYTFINTNLRYEFLDISSLTLGFTTGKTARNKIVSWQHFQGGAAIPANARRLIQLDDKTVSLDGKEISARLPGGVRFKLADGCENAIALADSWKRYPKGFSVEPKTNTVQIELLPRLPGEKFGKHLPFYLQFPFCGGAHRMKWGTSFTEKILFSFGPRVTEKEAAAEADLPVIALLPPRWYAQSGIWRGMAIPNLYKGIDKESLELFERNLQRREKHREYGAFNYGDSFGERNMQNWTNNEYDMSHGLFLFGLRTGRRDVLRSARAAARHEADVDVVHAYVLPYFVGCNIQHSCSHTGTYGRWSWPYRVGFNDGHSGHVWLRGMVDSWHLFGDGVNMDAAYLVGDHLNFAWVPGLENLVQLRDGAWNLIALCELAGSTGDPAYRKGADKLAAFLMKLTDTRTDWYMKRTGKARGGIAAFMCGIVLNSLCDYYHLTGKKEAADKCGELARWIVQKAFAPQFGGLFWYDITPLGYSNFPSEFLNALLAPGIMRAGAITGDKALFADGLLAFKALMMRHVPADGKSVALHLLFQEEVFQAAADHAKRFPGSIPRSFDRRTWRRSLTDRQNGSLMARGACRFVVKTNKKETVKLVWTNYNSPMGKAAVKSITVRDAAGKTVFEQKNLRPKEMRMDINIPLPGPGTYRLTLACDSRSMWTLRGDRRYQVFHDTAAVIPLISNVSSRFELEQLPGEKITVKFTPLHMGRFGLTVRTADGKELFSRSAFKHKTRMKGETQGPSWTIPAVPQKRKLFIEVFSGSGALLKVTPRKLLSRP